jgi:hypothetical protein
MLSFPFVSRELQTQVGVLKIKVLNGDMKCLVAQGRARKDLATIGPQRATLHKVIGERKRDQESMMIMKLHKAERSLYQKGRQEIKKARR